MGEEKERYRVTFRVFRCGYFTGNSPSEARGLAEVELEADDETLSFRVTDAIRVGEKRYCVSFVACQCMYVSASYAEEALNLVRLNLGRDENVMWLSQTLYCNPA